MRFPRTLFIVEITDDLAADMREDDTLTDNELAAWLVGDWRLVTVTVTASINGRRADDAAAELTDVRLGETLDWTFGIDDLATQIIAFRVCDLVTPRPHRAEPQRSALAA